MSKNFFDYLFRKYFQERVVRLCENVYLSLFEQQVEKSGSKEDPIIREITKEYLARKNGSTDK